MLQELGEFAAGGGMFTRRLGLGRHQVVDVLGSEGEALAQLVDVLVVVADQAERAAVDIAHVATGAMDVLDQLTGLELDRGLPGIDLLEVLAQLVELVVERLVEVGDEGIDHALESLGLARGGDMDELVHQELELVERRPERLVEIVSQILGKSRGETVKLLGLFFLEIDHQGQRTIGRMGRDEFAESRKEIIERPARLIDQAAVEGVEKQGKRDAVNRRLEGCLDPLDQAIRRSRQLLRGDIPGNISRDIEQLQAHVQADKGTENTQRGENTRRQLRDL